MCVITKPNTDSDVAQSGQDTDKYDMTSWTERTVPVPTTEEYTFVRRLRIVDHTTGFTLPRPLVERLGEERSAWTITMRRL